jgi:hypothetical protein
MAPELRKPLPSLKLPAAPPLPPSEPPAPPPPTIINSTNISFLISKTPDVVKVCARYSSFVVIWPPVGRFVVSCSFKGL